MTYDEEWASAKARFTVGSELSGSVERIAPFGVFVSVEGIARSVGVVADISNLHKDPADATALIWPEHGELVTGVVVDHSEHNHELKIALT